MNQEASCVEPQDTSDQGDQPYAATHCAECGIAMSAEHGEYHSLSPDVCTWCSSDSWENAPDTVSRAQ